MPRTIKRRITEWRALPRRRQIGIPAFLAVTGLSVWAALERGLFDGGTLFIAFLGSLLGLLQLVPSRPRLQLTDRTGQDSSELVATPASTRPFDEDEIEAGEVEVCKGEMPRQPRQGMPPGSLLHNPLQETEDKLLRMTRPLDVSDGSLRDYLAEVGDYTARLRNWLTDLEVARADRLRLLRLELRIRERGHAAADHVHLRLLLPDGFELDEGPMEVDLPPKRPEFRRDILPPAVSSRALHSLSKRLPDAADPRRPDDAEPRYSREAGLPRIDFELGRVNQSDHRDVPEFRIKAPREPGNYEVRWEITAAGLSRPARGAINIEIAEGQEDEPITSLEQAEEEQQRFGL